jgi:glycosyltransferase involved in cell wall biosynthesis
MRILYHHRTLADGAEGIHITAMVEAFRALGHEVRIAGAATADGGGASSAAAVKAWLPGVAFEAASVAYNGPEYLAVARAIRAWRPHFIYKRHARWDLGPLVAATRAGCPVVLEVNAVYSERPYRDFEPQSLQGLAKRMERAALRRAGTVIAVSSPMAAQVERLAGRAALVVPNGADPMLFDPARVTPAQGAWTSAGEGLVLGWSGGLREWHGLDLLLDAAALLPATTRVLIVGDGPARGAVEAKAASLGLEARVFVTGLVQRRQMPALVGAMDVGVVADERTGVASPMKMLEYMAMAKAVVAPDLPNIRDVIRHDENGLLFRPGDAGALAAAVATLGDRHRRAGLGMAARSTILAERNWRAIAAKVIALAAD